MKPFIILFLFLTSNPVCIKQQERITKIKLEYHSGMCQGYCDYAFIVNEKMKKTIRIPGKALPSPNLTIQRDSIALTKTDWLQITHSFSMDSLRALPKTNGCPGCDDGTIGTLTIQTDIDTISFQFEGPNPPQPIKPLTELITGKTFK